METYEQKKRRLLGKQNYFGQYLNELNRHVKIVNPQNYLISLEDTDNISGSLKRVKTVTR